MKKRLFICVLCLLVLYTLVGCNSIAKTNEGITIEHMTNAAITKEVIISEAVTNKAVITEVIPTVSESDSDEQIFSITSEDGNTIVTIDTFKDNNELRIEEISIIVNGVKLTTINDIIGYYDDISLDSQTSLAVITYHGRKWINFILLDIASGQIVYYEPFNFTNIQSTYANQMDYEINENDVITFSCNKILDDDSVLIDYQVTDMNDNLQSGTFKYIISISKFDDLQQNAPKSKG